MLVSLIQHIKSYYIYLIPEIEIQVLEKIRTLYFKNYSLATNKI